MIVIVCIIIVIGCVLALRRCRKQRISQVSKLDIGDIHLDAPSGYNLLPESDSTVRLAIVAMTRKPIAFETWLHHHVHTVGVEHFFLVVEDTPELLRLLASRPWSSYVTTISSSAQQGYFSLMDRQASAVRQGIESARLKGMTHIAHIDDDELIFCPNGVPSFKQHLGKSVASSIRMVNIEAVYDSSECNDPFKETRFFNVRPTLFTAYVNGKSIGRLGDPHLAPFGPHNYTGQVEELPSFVVVLLHYESACLDRWREKFKAYAHDTPTACKLGKIPFRFYCDSIGAFLEKTSAPEDVWYRYKTRTGRGETSGLVMIDRVV